MAQRYVRTYGGVTVTLTGDDKGLHELIASEQMLLPTLLKYADATEAKAKTIAESYPERDWPNNGSRRATGKRYTDSFDIEFGVSPRSAESPDPRVFARVINWNPFALYIEYGNRNIRPARRILRLAAGVNRFDAEGDLYG